MLELGDDAADEHRAIGALAGTSGIDVVIAVDAPGVAEGARGTVPELHEVVDVAAATAVLREILRPGDAVLVKASRAVGLERVADDLVTEHSR